MVQSEPKVSGFKYEIILSNRYSLKSFGVISFQDSDFEFKFSDYSLVVRILNDSKSIGEQMLAVQEKIRILEDYYNLMYGIDSIRFYFKGCIYRNQNDDNKYTSMNINWTGYTLIDYSVS